MLFRGFLLFFYIFSASCISANEAQFEEIASHPTWLKLGKYETTTETASGFISAIHDSKFFLSEAGQVDPKAELKATFDAFSNLQSYPDKQHPQCRFPARYIWLRETAPKLIQFSAPVACPDYDKWRFEGATESISVVFATGYLDNPASFYGHTLLKMNSSKHRQTANIEDVSVNYGAIVPNDEDPVSYILKGIFGGYDAGFSHTEYYFHTHNYGENELRDLWEYELAFDKKQVDFILAHAWEVLGKKYTYYFFRKNCSYRMAELLEIIPGINIIPQNPMFVMPQVLMKEISQETLANGSSLVKEIRRDESRQSKLYRYFKGLNTTQQTWLSRIAENQAILDTEEFAQLPTSDRSAIVETLMHHQLYLIKTEPDNKEHQEAYRKTLRKRFQLPAGKASLPALSPVPPHNSRPPSRIATGLVHNSQLGNAATLHYRPAYYDELDADSAHVSWSSLSMAEAKIRIDANRIAIEKLDIVAISSFNAEATNLPGDTMDTWGLKFGLRRQHLECNDCTSAYFEGTLGHGFQVFNQTKLIFEYGAGLQDQKASIGNLYGLVSGKLMARLNNNLSAIAAIQQRYFYDGNTANDTKALFEMRYKLAEDRDVRLLYQHHRENGLEVQFGWYF